MKKFLPLLLVFVLSSCSSYTLTKESLVEQLKQDQSTSQKSNVSSVGTNYTSNSLKQVKCIDKDGRETIVQGDKNTVFAITATNGKTSNLYFDTVYLSNDSLVGLKSRILGGKRRIALSEISSIRVKTEN